MGPLTQTLNGNSYLGLAVCAVTKYVEAAGKIALKNQNFFERVYTLVIQTYCNRGGKPASLRKRIFTIFWYHNSKNDQYFIFRYYISNVTKILQI